jgi:Subtilase family/PA domain
MRAIPRAALIAAGAALLTAPAAMAATADPTAARAQALDAAAGWRDVLEAHRAPPLPTPSDTESAILMLSGPAASATAPGDRARAAAAVEQRQRRLVPVLESLGATVTFRYRVLIDAVAVRVPAGRLEALAALPEVTAVVSVSFLAPAQVAGGAPQGVAPDDAAPPPPPAAGGRPLHVALIDAGIDPSHPWLGGGMGPTFPIIGGADLVDGDDDPRATGPMDAHGTEMASLLLRSPALAGLPPDRVPRLLAYRVVSPEPVGGRLRPLARSDRVLAALERAVDPDGDGATADGAEVILLGVAGGFEGAGVDPVAQALAAADRVGATVVAPAGNDGPTFARPGSVGGPAAAPTVIAVGGVSAGRTPRLADIEARVGPAAARLGPLPLMGPDPAAQPLPLVILRSPVGLASGDAPADYRDAAGASRVRGAVAVVARGGGSIADKAAQAAAAGAAALAVWDEGGPSSFPAVAGDAGMAIPVVGLGSRQGAALAHLAGLEPGFTVALRQRPVLPAPVAVASFSSWGPTVEGRQKPDLVAPAVAQPAAWPGAGPGGEPLTETLTGTSAAAASVAALAVRLRVDRPDLGPRAVHSLLLQAARPLPGVAWQRQGAGLAEAPGSPALRVEPPIVATRARRGGAEARIVLADLTGTAGRYRVSLATGAGDTPLTGAAVPAAGRTRLVLRLPARGASGRLVVRDAASGAVAAVAPLGPSRPARTPPDTLGRPQVRLSAGLAEVLLRLGTRRRVDARVRGAEVHRVRLALLPVAGGAPVPVAGAKEEGSWPAGTYRFLVARRGGSGLDVSPGAYRLRVTARGPDGRPLRTVSRRFTLR